MRRPVPLPAPVSSPSRETPSADEAVELPVRVIAPARSLPPEAATPPVAEAPGTESMVAEAPDAEAPDAEEIARAHVVASEPEAPPLPAGDEEAAAAGLEGVGVREVWAAARARRRALRAEVRRF
ncbi:MAG: hypothetical protein QM622_02135, partial [Microbacterium sp.]